MIPIPYPKNVKESIKITMTPTAWFVVGINLTFASGSLAIDWKDGSAPENFVSGTEKTHTYTNAGTYIAEITGSLINITKFIADSCRITKIENLKTGLLTDFNINSNLYSGNLDLSFAPVSTAFSVNSNSSLTSITFATTGNAKISSLSIRNCNITGALNLSNVPVGGSLFYVQNNPLLTSITFASSGNSKISAFYCLSNVSLTSLDLTNVPVGGTVSVSYNTTLTSISFSSTGNTIATSFDAVSCNLSSLNLTNLPIGGTFQVNNNINLSSITFSTTGNSICTTFRVFSTALISLDLTNVPVGGATLQFYTYSCSSLASITFASSGNGILKGMYMYDSSLGYINLASGGMSLAANTCSILIYNNGMNAAIVNHILVDLYSLVSGEGVGGDYTGRVINIGGTNADPDSSSGGYDGLTAKSNLEGKGITVTIT